MRNERANLFQILIVLLVASLVLYGFDYAGQLTPIRGALEGVMIALRINERPEQENVEELKAEAASLKQQNDQLAKEVETLKKQLDADLDSTYTLIPAYVVSVDKSTDDQTMILAKGSDDGVTGDMPVVIESVLIGTVKSTTPRLSHVRLLSSSKSKVTVKTTSNARGLIGGTSYEHGLTTALLDRVLQEEEINLDDTVLTSGEDELPENLVIGTIIADLSEDRAPFQQAEVQLAVDPSKLTQVFIIR